MSKEALGHDEAQIVFRACHGDIEQPPLLFYLGGSSGAKIGWHAAVDNVEDEHRRPVGRAGRWSCWPARWSS